MAQMLLVSGADSMLDDVQTSCNLEAVGMYHLMQNDSYRDLSASQELFVSIETLQ